ncbi:MAG: transposase [Thermodesulfobacteriota bacterium]
MADFSGYLAADEIYDGPFCVLYIVDNRTFRRLACEVLARNPTKEDVGAFFGRFAEELAKRGLSVRGVTTDGSPLYPDAIMANCPGARHQVCEFHVIKEINKAVIRALAKVRKQLAKEKPQLAKGRPAKEKKALVRKAKRIQERITELFENRCLFVKRELSASERAVLARITRGHPELRVLRQIVEEVYRLFDRRCRTQTALAKLAKLRKKVQRFVPLQRALKKLWSPNLEKALTFLDDELLPSTSNAVERTNRRHRKMQKSVYRVRTRRHVAQRIAMDMIREARAVRRRQALRSLHRDRTPPRAHKSKRRCRSAPVRLPANPQQQKKAG